MRELGKLSSVIFFVVIHNECKHMQAFIFLCLVFALSYAECKIEQKLFVYLFVCLFFYEENNRKCIFIIFLYFYFSFLICDF